VLQRVAACCSVLQRVEQSRDVTQCLCLDENTQLSPQQSCIVRPHISVSQRVAVCCSVLQCVGFSHNVTRCLCLDDNTRLSPLHACMAIRRDI